MILIFVKTTLKYAVSRLRKLKNVMGMGLGIFPDHNPLAPRTWKWN